MSRAEGKLTNNSAFGSILNQNFGQNRKIEQNKTVRLNKSKTEKHYKNKILAKTDTETENFRSLWHRFPLFCGSITQKVLNNLVEPLCWQITRVHYVVEPNLQIFGGNQFEKDCSMVYSILCLQMVWNGLFHYGS